MKKINILLVAGMVLLLACGSAFAFGFGSSAADNPTGPIGNDMPPDGDSAPVPEPATMLLLGTGLTGLAVAARKKKK